MLWFKKSSFFSDPEINTLVISNLGSFKYAANCSADAEDFLAADILPVFTAPQRTSAVNLA